jgi:signal transduction histidine kinase
VIHKDGSVRWVRVYAHPVWDLEHEQLAGIYGAIQDITDRKRAETEREHLIGELEARNAELERFTYTVSHDLKSPLITIGGFLGFLEKDARSGNIERFQADIRRIREAANTMRQLLDDLLELSRIGRLINPAQQIPFAEIVREALALVEGQLAARGVEVTVAPDLPSVYGDRTRLVEALQNLLDNAAKFMGEQPRPHITLGARGQGGERVLYVQDNGIGIDPQYHQKVFGLFEKLDASAVGTGIGLALVNRIVEVHGGRIWVESEGSGKGTTFCFTLPEQLAQSHL